MLAALLVASCASAPAPAPPPEPEPVEASVCINYNPPLYFSCPRGTAEFLVPAGFREVSR